MRHGLPLRYVRIWDGIRTWSCLGVCRDASGQVVAVHVIVVCRSATGRSQNPVTSRMAAYQSNTDAHCLPPNRRHSGTSDGSRLVNRSAAETISFWRLQGNPVEAIIPETVRPRRQILNRTSLGYNGGCRGVYRCAPWRRWGELGCQHRVVLECRLHSPPSEGVSLQLDRQVRSAAAEAPSSGAWDRGGLACRQYRGSGCGTQSKRSDPVPDGSRCFRRRSGGQHP